MEFKIRDSLKVTIVRDLIEPFYLEDIKSMIRGKTCWKFTGQFFETFSKILVAVGGIMSFSSGYFNDPHLSFLAGTVSTLSLATLQFSSFAYRENKKQGQDLNVLLKKLDLDDIPVLERRSETTLPPSVDEKPSEIIIGDISPFLVKTNLKNNISSPPPPANSVNEGLIISEFTPLQQQVDLKEQKSII
jgi:hypothetical protein